MTFSKKKYPIVLAVLLVLALLAGCTTSTNTTLSTTTMSTTKESTTEGAENTTANGGWQYSMGGSVSEEPVTIKVLTHSGWATTLAVPDPELPVYAAIAERLGITIDWQIIESATYGEMVNVRLMSNDLPDMVVLTDLNIAAQLVKDDFFKAYDDIGLEDNSPYASILLADPEYTDLESTYRSLFGDDKIYGYGCTVIKRYLGLNVMVNLPWLSNLGLEQPTTIDEFLDMLRAFRDEDANGNGDPDDEIVLSNQGGLPIYLGNALNLFMYYGWNLDENGKVRYEYASPEYLEYLKIRKLMFDENLIDKESRDMNSVYELVANDSIGAIAYWATFQPIISGKSPSFVDNETPVFQELIPPVNKYTNVKQRYSRPSSGVGEGMYILKVSEYPEVCLRTADWLWGSEEYKLLMNFGIEGDSYEMDADGMPVYTIPSDWEGSAGEYVTTLGGSQPPFAHMQWEVAWRAGQKKWINDRADEILETYIDGMPALVFTSAENDEINKYLTDLTTYRSEMEANFIEGRNSLDEYDDYVSQLYEMGLTEVLAIYQTKYDAVFGK